MKIMLSTYGIIDVVGEFGRKECTVMFLWNLNGLWILLCLLAWLLLMIVVAEFYSRVVD